MKKSFKQLWKWILKHKKGLIYGALALFISQFCFFSLWWLGGGNEVLAAGDPPSQNSTFQEKATGWLQDFSFLNRVCYVLLYPILFLAWRLVNNSFVYAAVFWFDTVLWQLRNIVRNLANYALWFVLLFKIFQYLTGGQKSGDLKKLLTSTLIAWIWIQASWFLLAVIIDLSNVLTYSVWWLPIHILGKQKGLGEEMANFWNPYVYQTAISFDFGDADTLHTYLATTWTGGSHYIAECETFSYNDKGKNEELIIAPEIVYYFDWKTYHPTEQNKCHVWEDVFNFAKGFAKGIDWQTGENPTWKDTQNKYKTSVEKAINLIKSGEEDARGLVTAWKIFQIMNAHATWNNQDPGLWTPLSPEQWLDVNNEINWNAFGLSRLQDILNGDDGYVWVFSALYSSLLNSGKDFRIEDAWIYTSLLNTLLSFCHTVAVGIPLVAMLVVFLMRIWVIRMAIVLSPAIILVKAFGWEEKMSKASDVLKYLTVSNLIGIIFSPAIICFAVSISTVLVRIISTVNSEGIIARTTTLFWWLIELNIASAWVSLWKLICSVIWVAISWFLIWSAVKASALWEKVKWLEKLARSAIWSIPIIPVPWKDWWLNYIWADKAFGLNGQRSALWDITAELKSKYQTQDNDALQDWLNWGDSMARAAKNRVSAYTTGLEKLSISDIQAWTWTEKIVSIWESKDPSKKMNLKFADFNNKEREEIINTINGFENEDKRKAFGESLWAVSVWKDVYNFNKTSNKYEVSNNNASTTNTPASS